MLGLFFVSGIFIRSGRAHHELARRNQDHLQLNAFAQVHREFLRLASCLIARCLGFLSGYQGTTAQCRQTTNATVDNCRDMGRISFSETG